MPRQVRSRLCFPHCISLVRSQSNAAIDVRRAHTSTRAHFSEVRLRKKTQTIVVTLSVTGTLESLQPPAEIEEIEEEEAPRERDWHAELPLRNKLIYRLCA